MAIRTSRYYIRALEDTTRHREVREQRYLEHWLEEMGRSKEPP